MAQILKECISIIRDGDPQTVENFGQRDDVSEFFDEIRDAPGCNVLRVSS